jgi:hypothetical protein
VRSRLVVEVPSLEQRYADEIPAEADLRWVVGGNGVAPSRIEQIVRGAERPDGLATSVTPVRRR